jgi:ligand-binding SRPBCC domain-containing protein
MKWKTEITEYEPPSMFVDEADAVPYSFWRHRHTFRETAEGTVVADRVEYDLPFGPLGRLAHGFTVAPQLRRIFDHRSERSRAFSAGPPLRVEPPSIRRA